MEKIYDFGVDLQPIMTLNPVNGGSDLIDRKKAVVRQDNGAVLGVVSDKYQLLKHADVIDSFRTALDGVDYDEKIQVAKGGAQLFATYRLNGVKLEVAKGDLVSLQFIVKNSYDGTNALQIMLGAYRLVCTNGMVVGKQFFSFSQKHFGNDVSVKIETIREKVGMLRSQFGDTLPHLQEMSRTSMLGLSNEEIEKKIGAKLPKYLIEEVKTRFSEDGDHTLWGFYNAMTSAISHNLKRESPISTINFGKAAWSIASKELKAA